jgi:hypothetical protein
MIVREREIQCDRESERQCDSKRVRDRTERKRDVELEVRGVWCIAGEREGVRPLQCSTVRQSKPDPCYLPSQIKMYYYFCLVSPL